MKSRPLTRPAGTLHPEGVATVNGTCHWAGSIWVGLDTSPLVGLVCLGSGSDPLTTSFHGPLTVSPMDNFQSLVPLDG